MTEIRQEPSQPQQLAPERKRALLSYCAPLSVLGFVLCAALELLHLQTHLRPTHSSFCSVGQTFDCVAVAAASEAVFLGIPWALWGLAGFSALLLASLQRSIWLLPLSLIAAGVSAVLFCVSWFKIGSFCFLCEGVHLTSWLLAWQTMRGRASLYGRLSNAESAWGVLAAPAGLIAALFLFLPAYWGSFSYKGQPPLETGRSQQGHPWIGAKNPRLTIEEFVDYRCPHCKVASARTLRRLAKADGVRLVRRQQPRLRCGVDSPSSCLAVRMAYCAQAQGAFWRADRWLFAHLDPRKELQPAMLAQDLDLNPAEFLRCVEASATRERAISEAKQARKRKIIDVPGYIVDGKKVTEAEIEKYF